jgi:hypothetical protein
MPSERIALPPRAQQGALGITWGNLVGISSFLLVRSLCMGVDRGYLRSRRRVGTWAALRRVCPTTGQISSAGGGGR